MRRETGGRLGRPNGLERKMGRTIKVSVIQGRIYQSLP